MTSEYHVIEVETLDDGQICRISLNRPDARNAQNRGLLVELDHAMLAPESDDGVRVVILRGLGPMFSAGHDMGSSTAVPESSPGPGQHPTMLVNGGTKAGAEQRAVQEWHFYFQNTLRWRNLRKITVPRCMAAAPSRPAVLVSFSRLCPTV